MKVAEVMTPTVISITSSQTVAEAIDVMLREDISALPVVNTNGALVGIITEGDFLRRTEIDTEKRRPRWLEWLRWPGRLAEEYTHTHARKIDAVMTTDVITVTAGTVLEKAVELLERHRIKRLPVVRRGQLIGIISRADLLRALAHSMAVSHVVSSEVSSSPTDSEISDSLAKEVKKQSWTPRSSISWTVKNGVVDLSGTIFDERERQALRVLAENVPGVLEVEDHMVWVNPLSGDTMQAS